MSRYSPQAPPDPRVEAMVAMLDVNPRLTGGELSAQMGLSVSRLVRVFKEQTGVSMVDYRNTLRFRRFFELIGAGDAGRQPLRQTAMAAGFGSYAHFHRLFRARWHMAPREGLRQRRSAGG